MRVLLAAGLICLSLNACSRVASPPTTAGNFLLDADTGAVVFALGLDERIVTTPFTLTIRPYDPATNRILHADDPEREADATTVNYATDPKHGMNRRIWIYKLPAGTYVIESIETTKVLHEATFVEPPGSLRTYRGYNDNLTGQAIIQGFLYTLSAIGAEATQREVRFVDGRYLLLPDAPRFEITAGKVSYIGEILFDAEEAGPKATEAAATGSAGADATDYRIIVDYRFDMKLLHTEGDYLGLTRHDLIGAPLAAFDDRRFVLTDFTEFGSGHWTLPRAPVMVPADEARPAAGEG